MDNKEVIVEEVKEVKEEAVKVRKMTDKEQAIYNSIELRPMSIVEFEDYTNLIKNEATVLEVIKWVLINIYPEVDPKKVSFTLSKLIMAETNKLTLEDIEDMAKN
jgi:Fe-S-cluster formation regulator IscX/YfhJ